MEASRTRSEMVRASKVCAQFAAAISPCWGSKGAQFGTRVRCVTAGATLRALPGALQASSCSVLPGMPAGAKGAAFGAGAAALPTEPSLSPSASRTAFTAWARGAGIAAGTGEMCIEDMGNLVEYGGEVRPGLAIGKPRAAREH